ncbi:alpha-tocopherol transfer protein-like [Rhipicephalus microplus]|uniref:alpha-tocopherol transfer protein-like n=1 Tax=Rhipicephalus microplus TaxID=6941 RepID=UPI003F6B1B2A
MSGVYTKKCVDDVFDTSEGALPFKLQRIAEDELGETQAKRQDALEKLTQLLEAEPDLNANKDPKFLLRFLRVRKFDVDGALQTIRNYYRNRASCVTIYRDFLPRKARPAGRKLMMVMPYRDVHGRPIILCKPGVWMPAEIPYADLQCTWLICMEYIAADPAAQILGVVLLVDFAEFTADKIISFSFGLIRRALEYIQDCMPMRMKAIHIVKQSYAFDLFFALIKPFIKAKLAERFRFHGENFEKLHEEISPKTLPEEYEGRRSPIDPEEFWKRVDAAEKDFAAANRFGYPMKDQDDLPPDTEELKQELTSL